MVFSRYVPTCDDDYLVEGDGVFLRYPRPEDYSEWAVLRGESREFLVPWEPSWPADDLTKAAYRRRMRRYARDIKEDLAHPFFVFRSEDAALVGGGSLSNITRGVAASCSLGYWIGEAYQRRGYMFAAVKALLPFAFDELRLRRVEAACLPENTASQGLLRKAGFTEEGLAREYLKINSVWRDHLLFAMVKGDLAR